MPVLGGGVTDLFTADILAAERGERFDSEGRVLVELRSRSSDTLYAWLDPDAVRIGISGTVFEDADYNGEIGEADRGFSNVPVELYTDDGSGNPAESEPLQSMFSLIDGTYHFDGLAAGSYVVKINPLDETTSVWDKTEPTDDGLVLVSYASDRANAGNDFLLEKELSYELGVSLHKLNLAAVPVENLDLGLQDDQIDEPLEVTTDLDLLSRLTDCRIRTCCRWGNATHDPNLRTG